MSILDRWSYVTRGEQAGMFLAGAAVPFTFQHTLMDRGISDQALATGIVMALEYAVGALTQDSVESLAARAAGFQETDNDLEDSAWRGYSIAIDLAAIALGNVFKRIFKQRPGEVVGLSWARTLSRLLADGTSAGLFIAVAQVVLDNLGLSRLHGFSRSWLEGVIFAILIDTRRRRAEDAIKPDYLSNHEEIEAIGLSSLIALGLAGITASERLFAGGISQMLGRIFHTKERLLRPIGHLAAIMGVASVVGLIMKVVFTRMEDVASQIEPAFNTPPRSPFVSGGPGSLIPWESLSHQGRRFVSTVLRIEWIRRVMDEAVVEHPIRVFAALDGAGTDEERVDLALRELERTGAFDRSLLMVISPTGTGYVNYVAVEAAEYFSLGDMASIALQYSKRPSVLSLDRVPEGVKQYRMFLDALHSRLEELPPEKRPRVVLFGESLGAWTSEDAFKGEGTDGMEALGIDRGLWIGTPHATKWKEEVLGSPRDNVDKSKVGVFNDFEQVEALSPEERDKLRYVMITHYNDAVAHFGLDLLVREPPWLGDPEKRPPTVPKTEIYNPLITFVLTLIDMKNSANVVPGRFEAKGHDYRKDLARFVRETYALPCSDLKLDYVERALREYELFRKEWIDKLDKPEEKKKATKENGLRANGRNNKHKSEKNKKQ